MPIETSGRKGLPHGAGLRRPARGASRWPCRTVLHFACLGSGYTLLELLLVLAILVAVASAVAPTVVARMSEYRLKEGTETARAALSATRIHAIDVSSVYQFRFETGGRRFLAIPTDGDALTNSQKAGERSGGNFAPVRRREWTLPERLSFQIVATVGVPGDDLTSNEHRDPHGDGRYGLVGRPCARSKWG